MKIINKIVPIKLGLPHQEAGYTSHHICGVIERREEKGGLELILKLHDFVVGGGTPTTYVFISFKKHITSDDPAVVAAAGFMGFIGCCDLRITSPNGKEGDILNISFEFDSPFRAKSKNQYIDVLVDMVNSVRKGAPTLFEDVMDAVSAFITSVEPTKHSMLSRTHFNDLYRLEKCLLGFHDGNQ